MAHRVLLVDDDHRLFELLDDYLGENGCQVSHAADGGRGLAALEKTAYDVVLLDMMMPGMDGLEVLRRIRLERTLPVLMLTAKGDETDRVVGLELGADDYLPKPFGPRGLLARIRAVLRRSQPDAIATRIVVGALQADAQSRIAQLHGEALDLTGLEFDLLLALMRRAGRVVPRDSLLTEAGRTDVVVGERTGSATTRASVDDAHHRVLSVEAADDGIASQLFLGHVGPSLIPLVVGTSIGMSIGDIDFGSYSGLRDPERRFADHVSRLHRRRFVSVKIRRCR